MRLRKHPRPDESQRDPIRRQNHLTERQVHAPQGPGRAFTRRRSARSAPAPIEMAWRGAFKGITPLWIVRILLKGRDPVRPGGNRPRNGKHGGKTTSRVKREQRGWGELRT